MHKKVENDHFTGFRKYFINHFMIGYILVFIIFAVGYYFASTLMGLEGIIIAVIAYVFIISAFIGIYTGCRNCNRFFAVRKVSIEILHSKKEIRHIKGFGNNSKQSEIWTVQKVRNHFRCAKCGNRTHIDDAREIFGVA